MKRNVALLATAAAAAFLAASPASAQHDYDNVYSENGYQTQRSYNRAWRGDRHGWNQNGWNNGWNSRNVAGADPSFGNRAGINNARRSGRCVVDLGYGRYEYCGW